jgi:hypothetical protein
MLHPRGQGPDPNDGDGLRRCGLIEHRMLKSTAESVLLFFVPLDPLGILCYNMALWQLKMNLDQRKIYE